MTETDMNEKDINDINKEETDKEEINEDIKEEKKESTEEKATEENTSGECRENSEEAEAGETGSEEKPEKKDPRDEKIDELTDRWKRLMAEFDNFRKRTDAEKAGMYSEGERTVLEKVLPVVDNFERALSTVPEDKKGDSFVDGMEKIYRQFTELLKSFGVEPIEAVGKSFDANFHNAVMHVEDEEKGEGEIVEEFQKGYMYRDKVLRYSMVKVAN